MGMLVSTAFTLVVVPAVLSLFVDVREGLGRRFSQFRAAARHRSSSMPDVSSETVLVKTRNAEERRTPSDRFA
jgi:hypothetical protein